MMKIAAVVLSFIAVSAYAQQEPRRYYQDVDQNFAVSDEDDSDDTGLIFHPAFLFYRPRTSEQDDISQVLSAEDSNNENDGEYQAPSFYPSATIHRLRRSLQAGAPNFPVPGGNNGNNAGVDIARQGPNTQATINAQHGTDRYDVGGQWSKVVRGPAKAKPNWNVHGTYRW